MGRVASWVLPVILAMGSACKDSRCTPENCRALRGCGFSLGEDPYGLCATLPQFQANRTEAAETASCVDTCTTTAHGRLAECSRAMSCQPSTTSLLERADELARCSRQPLVLGLAANDESFDFQAYMRCESSCRGTETSCTARCGNGAFADCLACARLCRAAYLQCEEAC